MEIAYIAINSITNDWYAICSADPDFLSDAAKEISRWKKDGAIIELLSKSEAIKRFSESLQSQDSQIKMFEKHLD